MSYFYYTNIPNTFFDIHLEKLGYAELKVLLVIMRQTYGWKDRETGKYKQWDWISQRFFVRKTGLSARAVSTAISRLHHKEIIRIKDDQGNILIYKKQRRKASRLYFSCSLSDSCEVNHRKAVKKVHTTIIKHTKMSCETDSQGLKKISFTK